MKNKYIVLVLWLGVQLNTLQAQQWDGLTYYSTVNSTTGFLIDTASTVVKTWSFTGGTGYSTHMIPGGTLYRSVINPGNYLTGGGMHGRIQKVDYSGTVLWDFKYSSQTYCLHHDLCPMPNGNVLVICYEVKTAADVLAAGGTTNIAVWSEKVMELEPVGTNSANVVWEWKLWDHLVQDVQPSAANYQSSIVNNPQLMNINYKLKKDWVHMNGIDYNPVLDQIALSSHNINEWYIIDHSTTTAEAASHSGGNAGMGGDFLYRWGNPAAYAAPGNTVLNVTHDAHWIPEDCVNGGNLAGVNNKGMTVPSNKTTADQAIVPRVDYNYTLTPGSAFTPTNYSARVPGIGYTSNMGSSQQFPNGNQMICLAVLGTIYEVGPAGNTLWTKSTGGVTAQSHRYSSCYVNNPAPPIPTITAVGNQLSSTPANSYQWYMNGNAVSGATTQVLSAAQNGIYVVKVTDQNGCVYSYSQSFKYPPNSGNLTGLETNSIDRVLVFPNPTDGIIYFKHLSPSARVEVYNMTGALLLEKTGADQLSLQEFGSGLYLVKISEANKTIFKKINLVK